MKTLLLLFVSAVAWGQTIESRVVMLKGTSLPGTCVVGERFFKTDATAGANIYLCTSTNTWTQVTGGSGASAIPDLTDLKVTTSGATLTMAAGNFGYLGSDGRWTVAAMSSATWVISGGTDTGTARFEIDPNGGSPIWRCLYDGSMTATNYTPSNCTETSGSVFSVGAYPVATVAVSSGAWSTVTDFRALPQVVNYTVDGNYLLKSGNALSFNPAASFPWTGPHSSDSTYNFCADAGASDTYACTISPAITAYVTGGHYFFTANTVNTGAATINLNSLGAKTIKKYTGTGGADLSDADIRAGAIVHVVYDGTNMQLQTGLGNAGGGGTPGGSTTQIQYNNAGAFGGEAGLTWDATNKVVTITRSNSSGTGGRLIALNSAGTNTNAGARLDACQNNSTGECGSIIHGHYDLASEGAGSTTQLRTQAGGSDYYQLIGRRGDTSPVHIGGSVGAGLGWVSFNSIAMTRFGNVATAGIGLAPIMGAPTELTGQTGNLGAQTLLATSHTAGMYRVCGFVAITAAGTGASAEWTLAWRSPASGSDLTHNLFFSSGAAETDTFPVTAADEMNVCKVIRSTGASAISLNPGDMNTATFNTAWTVERLR